MKTRLGKNASGCAIVLKSDFVIPPHRALLYNWRKLGMVLSSGIVMVLHPLGAIECEGHYDAVSVSAPVADFTEQDLQSDGSTDGNFTSMIILEANGGTGGPYLVKAAIDDYFHDGYRLPTCPFKRSGYTFVGWEAYNACIRSKDLEYYYRIGNKRIGGGFTGIYQPGFLYFICGHTAFRAKWEKGESALKYVPAEWRKARTLKGLWGEGCAMGIDGAEGTAQLKCSKANKKGIAKVSLTITPFVGKKRTYRSVAVDVSHGGRIEVRWPQQKYAVTIYGNDFFGEPIYDEARPACTPNSVWSADVGGQFNKTARFNFGDIPNDHWYVMDELMIVDGNGWVDVFDPVAVTMSNFKWTCPRASRLGSIRIYAHATHPSTGTWEWALKTHDDADNIPALKLSYSAKTGIFKGRFNIYCDGRKKYSAKVTGVMVDGEGYGLAFCKKLSSEPWAVSIR